MGFGGAIFALTAAQAVGQISQGYVQKAEFNANASITEGKIDLINIQQGIEAGQYERAKSKMEGQTMARIAGANLMPSGSPMAVLLDAQTQMNIDKAIGQFNFEQEKIYTKAEADQLRRKGKQAVFAGYSNAFSTALSGASSYAMYKGFQTKPTKPTNKISFTNNTGLSWSDH